MTLTQMTYFITVARCLSITQAARQLYITQPALSKQIAVIERELNMQLFVREDKHLRLTPPGRVLLETLPGVLEQYEEAVARAATAYQGYQGTLRVGVLDGHTSSEEMFGAIRAFNDEFRNVEVQLTRSSFEELRNALYQDELDVAVTLSFDIEDHADLHREKLFDSEALVAMQRSHPLAQKQGLQIADLADELFIVPQDSPGGVGLYHRSFSKDAHKPNIRFAPNLRTIMLWVETGIGVAVLNANNALAENPAVVMRSVQGLFGTEVVAAWRRSNKNEAVPMFVRKLRQHMG